MNNNKNIIETVKTIVIAVLTTGIITFIGGYFYGHTMSTEVLSEAKALSASVSQKEAPTPVAEQAPSK